MRSHAREFGLFAALVAFALVLGLLAPGFFTPGNLKNLALDNLPLLVIATGMTLVILAGEIDVSVGAQFAACGVLAGVLAKLGLPLIVVAPCVLVCAAGFGALQGALVASGVPAIVVTLASLAIVRGLLRWTTGGRWIADLPSGFQWFGLGQAGGQVLAAIAVAFLLASTAVSLRWLSAARALHALGCNAEAARLAGVRVARVRVAVFALLSAFAAAAALISVTRYPAIEIEAGAGLELQAIACVVLGGASIRGGRATLVGTWLGVALLGTLGTALVFLGVGAAWERAVQGAIILAALAPEWVRARRPSEARA